MQTSDAALSVICVFRDCKEQVEPTLKALYSLKSVQFELIVIDDASEDGTADTIRSVIEYYQHELTYFFEHESRRGRGNSLNSALEQVRNRFVWIPESLHKIHENELLSALSKFEITPSCLALGWDGPTPETPSDWLQMLSERRIPCDRDFLFDLHQIPMPLRFIDPHVQARNASEWAIRLLKHSPPLKTVSFTGKFDEEVIIEEEDANEIILALLRSSGLSLRNSEIPEMILRETAYPETSHDQSETGPEQPEYSPEPHPGTEQVDNGPDEDHFARPTESEHETAELSPKTRPEEQKKTDHLEEDSSAGNQERFELTEQKPEDETDSHVTEDARILIRDEIDQQPPLSIIIPSSTTRRQLLQACVQSVFRYTHPDRTRLIIIDNGSLDDTSSYLDHLYRENRPLFVHANRNNVGFAAAVNQGLEKAEEGPVMILHNDVVLTSPLPARLVKMLDQHPDIGLLTPAADQTWNPDQSFDNLKGKPAISDLEYVDGYCMVFRNQHGIRFSDKYGLAFFEDVDFCYRLKKKGYRIAVANREMVRHRQGATTGDLGLTMHGKSYWKNASLFQKTWNLKQEASSDTEITDPLDQLLLVGRQINPFYPDKKLLDLFETLFTSELKTRVHHTRFSQHDLKAIIRLMIAAEQREVLRRLEEQLNEYPPDLVLYHDLIVFYCDRTIYSRCKQYFDRIEEDPLPVDLDLYRLKIAVGEKDYSRAARLLKDLMDRIPTHPEVLLAAAEIHRRSGSREESEKFLALAQQLNPYLSN